MLSLCIINTFFIYEKIWKKPPFLPRPAKRVLKIPKTPPLLTAVRAQERKRFEEKLKEKEREKEMLKCLVMSFMYILSIH